MRHAAQVVGEQAADGVDVLVGEVRAEGFVELADLGQPAHAHVAVGGGEDVVFLLVEIVFVLDVADDLLQHVFDGDQAGHAAVFIDDDGDVVAVDAEVAQQHVQPLGFGNEHGRAQHVAHVEAFVRVVAQQVLGQQDADDVVAAALVDGEARMRGLLDEGDEFGGRVGDVDRVHLRARDHDVARAQVGDLEDPFDHRQGVGIDQVARVRVLEDFQQLGPRLGLGRDEIGQAFQQRAGFVGWLRTGIRIIHGAKARCYTSAQHTPKGRPSR